MNTAKADQLVNELNDLIYKLQKKSLDALDELERIAITEDDDKKSLRATELFIQVRDLQREIDPVSGTINRIK